ncbi:hypothetical protein [Fontibacter flavus]|uniref:PH domain-containing protein n=1 Tax=Fontibacter flavus TaxID=654838 RepID=A0ABV6FR78_9BACT
MKHYGKSQILKTLLNQDGIRGGKMILRISAYNQLRVLSFHLIGTIFMLVALYLLKFNIDFVVVFGGMYVLLTLPLLYLHIEYYIANRKQVITIEDDEFTISTQNGYTHKFKFTELSNVILYKSASLDKGGIQITPIESYHYARIITKSERQIIITCLMSPKLEEVVNELKGVQKKRKKRLFCTLLWK